MTAITERIVSRMREQGLEEIDLAAGVRVAQSTVNRWTHHLSDPRASSVPVLAKTLDVSVAWLLTGEEQPFDDATVLSLWSIMSVAAEALHARAEKLPRRVTQEWYDDFVSDQVAFDNVRTMLGLGEDARTEAARRHVDEALRFAQSQALKAKERLDESTGN